MSKAVTIAGGGIAGLSLALLLAQKNQPSTVIEKRPDPSLGDGRRSINLALSHRGRKTLKALSLLPAIEPHLVNMYGRSMHVLGGKVKRYAYDLCGEKCIYSTRRSDLVSCLLEAARKNELIDLRFGTEIRKLNLDEKTVVVGGSHQATETIGFEFLIGADGANSVVAGALEASGEISRKRQRLGPGYKEFPIQNPEAWYLGLEQNCLHVWPRGEFMLIALPCADGSFMATLFLTNETDAPEWTLDRLSDPQCTAEFIRTFFPELTEYGLSFTERLSLAPACSINSVTVDRWTSRDQSIVLIGDAAHAMAPFLGQGMNCAMEDCLVFMNAAEESGFDWQQTARSFEARRKEDAAAICRLSYSNYLEMRKTAVEEQFLRRRGIDFILQKTLPRKFLPCYAMIAFTSIPYSEVEARALEQDRVIGQIFDAAGDIGELDFEGLVDKAGRQLTDLSPDILEESGYLPAPEHRPAGILEPA